MTAACDCKSGPETLGETPLADSFSFFDCSAAATFIDFWDC
jgi:hypothetical protein